MKTALHIVAVLVLLSILSLVVLVRYLSVD